MILISNKVNWYQYFIILLLFSLWPLHSLAQASLTLSVTPTLFQMAAEPGQVWQSHVKVVNSNPYQITVYAEAVNFVPQGEVGQGKFVPVFDEVTDGATLAEWIKLDKLVPIVIPAEQSQRVPFVIEVPEDAAPGGHFAAILVSTKPPEDTRAIVQTSQAVTSLFFLRLEGDVIEDGHVRSFSVQDRVVESPRADFVLRFENKGNVHLQPQGHIAVKNMWGKERGKIPINMQTHFGNVLPQTIRKFEFAWTGESSVTDIGRYKAEVALAYGAESKKFETHEVYFWVIPLKPFLITLSLLAIIIGLVVWMIRLYVRRMLVLAGLNPDSVNQPTGVRSGRSKIVYEGDVAVRSYRSVSAPVRAGWRDFYERLRHTQAFSDTWRELLGFVLQYRLFFVALVTGLIIITVVFMYIRAVTVAERDYEVSITNPDQTVSLNSEEVHLQELQSGVSAADTSDTQTYTVTIVNMSGVPGTAAEVAHQLEQKAITVSKLSSEADQTKKKTVIVYDPTLSEEALAISKVLGEVLITALPEAATTTKPNIAVYIGEDQI